MLAMQEDANAPWYVGLRELQLRLHAAGAAPDGAAEQLFVIVERSRAMNNMMTERNLQASGGCATTATSARGQMVAADYTMSPSIQFAQKTGGASAGLPARAFGGLGAFGRRHERQRGLDHAAADRTTARACRSRRPGHLETTTSACSAASGGGASAAAATRTRRRARWWWRPSPTRTTRWSGAAQLQGADRQRRPGHGRAPGRGRRHDAGLQRQATGPGAAGKAARQEETVTPPGARPGRDG